MTRDTEDPDMAEIHAWAARELAKIDLPPLTAEQSRLIDMWPRDKPRPTGRRP